MKRFGLLCLALVLAFGSLGIGYALWSDQLYIEGNIDTGRLDWCFSTWRILDPFSPADHGYQPASVDLLDYTCHDGFAFRDPPNDFNQFWHLDKNVSWAEITPIPATGCVKTLEVTLHDTYPCNFHEIGFYIFNNGTLPLRIWKVIIDDGGPNETTLYATGYTGLDLSGPAGAPDGNDDIEISWGDNFGAQVHPGEPNPDEISFWIHTLQAAPQDETMTFTMTLVCVQYNEYLPGPIP